DAIARALTHPSSPLCRQAPADPGKNRSEGGLRRLGEDATRGGADMTQRMLGRSASPGTDRTVGRGGGGGCDESGWPVLDSLLGELAELAPEDPTRTRLREYIICRCAPAARREAMRYRNTGEPIDDLVQVATLGLILAVDRYDAGRGIPFR